MFFFNPKNIAQAQNKTNKTEGTWALERHSGNTRSLRGLRYFVQQAPHVLTTKIIFWTYEYHLWDVWKSSVDQIKLIR